MSAVDALRRLQDADSHIAALRTDLMHVRAELRGDAELERSRSTAAGARQARDEADASARAAEAAMKELESRTRALDRKLYDGSVHNPHELLEMQHELETLRGRLGDAEVTALAELERSEDAQRAEEAAAADVAAHEARRAASLQPLQQRLTALEANLAAAERDRGAVLEGVPQNQRALYDRVAARRQPAVVGLSGEACGGCHLPLSIEERRRVRTGDGIVQCSNCDRILMP